MYNPSHYTIIHRDVKKHYNEYEGKSTLRNKPSKLDKYYELIQQTNSIEGANTWVMYEFIFSKRIWRTVPTQILTNISKSKDLGRKNVVGHHPRFEITPDIQAQAKLEGRCIQKNKFGENFTVYVFDYKLGNPRCNHFMYKRYKTECIRVLDCFI